MSSDNDDFLQMMTAAFGGAPDASALAKLDFPNALKKFWELRIIPDMVGPITEEYLINGEERYRQTSAALTVGDFLDSYLPKELLNNHQVNSQLFALVSVVKPALDKAQDTNNPDVKEANISNAAKYLAMEFLPAENAPPKNMFGRAIDEVTRRSEKAIEENRFSDSYLCDRYLEALQFVRAKFMEMLAPEVAKRLGRLAPGGNIADVDQTSRAANPQLELLKSVRKFLKQHITTQGREVTKAYLNIRNQEEDHTPLSIHEIITDIYKYIESTAKASDNVIRPLERLVLTLDAIFSSAAPIKPDNIAYLQTEADKIKRKDSSNIFDLVCYRLREYGTAMDQAGNEIEAMRADIRAATIILIRGEFFKLLAPALEKLKDNSKGQNPGNSV